MRRDTMHSDGKRSSWTFWRWQNITRADDQPYLLRLIVFRCAWFAVYVHWFMGDDDLCLHDHPWRFASIILRGGYWEWTDSGRRWYPPGSVLLRPPQWRHRIVREPGRMPVTLVVAGRKRRDWGFWTHRGFIHWKRYSHREHCG